MKYSLEKLLVVLTFVNLQGFIVGRRIVVKEVTVLKKGRPNVMEVIDKIRKVLRFLVDCLSP